MIANTLQINNQTSFFRLIKASLLSSRTITPLSTVTLKKGSLQQKQTNWTRRIGRSMKVCRYSPHMWQTLEQSKAYTRVANNAFKLLPSEITKRAAWSWYRSGLMYERAVSALENDSPCRSNPSNEHLEIM
jgi:hypothetical protein